MPNTYTSLHYHVFFSTKNRDLWINKEWRDRFWEYLGGTIAGLGGHPHQIGGVADHVHLALGLKPTHCVSKVLQELKKASSAWVHRELELPGFAWQDGYTALTVSASVLPKLVDYVATQEQHHLRKTFREEMEEFLRKAGVKFDPKYLD
jgi:putative transposase